MSLLASLDSEICKLIAALDPSAILVIAPQGTIKYASPSAGRMFGWDPDELVGQPVTHLVPERRRDVYTPFDPARVAESYERARAQQLELFGLNRDGREFPVELAHRVFDTPDGCYLLGVVTDVSPLRALRALERSSERLQRSAELGTLAAGIAHDFGNTMLAMGGYLAMARKALGDTPQQDLLRAEAAATRAFELVDRLLGFLRGHERERRPVNLAAVVSEASHLLRPSLPAHIRVQLALDAAAPNVVADESAILQIVVNLMMNSVQAMPVGGQLRVNVQRFTPDPEWVARHPNSDHGLFVRLEFFDTGIGMTQEVMRQAFDAGFTTRPHGNGLGLHNVKRVVDTLGGVIEIDSAPGRGTQFAITLPAKPAARVQ